MTHVWSKNDDSVSSSGASVPAAAEYFHGKRALIVVAYQDDAVLFAGSLLAGFHEIALLCTTDGAPSRRRARRSGFRRRHDCAAARRKEVDAALATGVIEAERHWLPIKDGHASLSTTRIIRELEGLFRSFAPDVVLTHAYEGGHRDHDTTAFAVHAAAERQRARDRIWEMACYHVRNGVMENGLFLPNDLPGEVIAVALSRAAMERKAAMLDRFRTQRAAVGAFGSSIERFRNGAALARSAA